MLLQLIRTVNTPTTTLGKLFIDGIEYCYTLEDTDRGLTKSMPLEDIKKKKIRALTAIPKGTYQVVISYSPRFKRQLPLLLNVPGYSGIRIHPGNKAEHTEGCILVGEYFNDNYIKNSVNTFNKLFTLLEDISKKDKIHIEVT